MSTTPSTDRLRVAGSCMSINDVPPIEAANAVVPAAYLDWRRFDVELTDAMLTGVGVDLDRLPVADDAGYLYVIEFDTGVVKVGQTRDPRRRLAEHRRAASAYGVSITRVWISQPHVEYLATEAVLILGCAEFSAYSRREYFHEINWSEAVEFAFWLTEGRQR